jgi:hypothetical protein
VPGSGFHKVSSFFYRPFCTEVYKIGRWSQRILG